MEASEQRTGAAQVARRRVSGATTRRTPSLLAIEATLGLALSELFVTMAIERTQVHALDADGECWCAIEFVCRCSMEYAELTVEPLAEAAALMEGRLGVALLSHFAAVRIEFISLDTSDDGVLQCCAHFLALLGR